MYDRKRKKNCMELLPQELGLFDVYADKIRSSRLVLPGLFWYFCKATSFYCPKPVVLCTESCYITILSITFLHRSGKHSPFSARVGNSIDKSP
jgi:hypothetical protein